MFDIGFPELVVISIVALLVIGPEKLPETVRTISLWIGRIQRSFRSIRAEIESEIGADEIRAQLHNEQILKDIETTKASIKSVKDEVTNTIKSVEDDVKQTIDQNIDQNIDQKADESADKSSDHGAEPDSTAETPGDATDVSATDSNGKSTARQGKPNKPDSIEPKADIS